MLHPKGHHRCHHTAPQMLHPKDHHRCHHTAPQMLRLKGHHRCHHTAPQMLHPKCHHRCHHTAPQMLRLKCHHHHCGCLSGPLHPLSPSALPRRLALLLYSTLTAFEFDLGAHHCRIRECRPALATGLLPPLQLPRTPVPEAFSDRLLVLVVYVAAARYLPAVSVPAAAALYLSAVSVPAAAAACVIY